MIDPLYDQAIREAVVQAYLDGEKIKLIEERMNIPRSSIYWILAESGKVPRMRRADRVVGDREQLAHLYELLEAQNNYIKDLETENAELKRMLGRQ